MILSSQAFNELLPPYLHEITKGRIRNALSQFTLEGDINYNEFYTASDHDFLMQADILNSVRGILWDENSGEPESGYNPAMLISNSCDVSFENTRSLNQKDALFAPIVPLGVYLDNCLEEGFTQEQINSFVAVLRKQEYTNLFYLPPNPLNHTEYFVRLDRIYWLPISQLSDTMQNLKESRFLSLSQWAWYLFLVKLSLHTCRVPETIERSENL